MKNYFVSCEVHTRNPIQANLENATQSYRHVVSHFHFASYRTRKKLMPPAQETQGISLRVELMVKQVFQFKDRLIHTRSIFN